MLEWARTGLGAEHSFEVAHFNYSKVGGPERLLGVKAARDMEPGDIACRMPFNSLMTAHTIESDPVLVGALGFYSVAYKDTYDNMTDGERPDYYLLPLVLLYHMSLGEKVSVGDFVVKKGDE